MPHANTQRPHNALGYWAPALETIHIGPHEVIVIGMSEGSVALNEEVFQLFLQIGNRTPGPV